ncbi:autotransporter assembly complex protein TamA [Rhodoferax sp. UBA5149]|uniref:autotransporter assembly complex protein TamA n=1 Tax=Rhodoferax sp. UBA5149 TaxID=1947379 RepID=UPI0025F622B4|nr:autotransporter assembly complex family protein [Rhodoferax sp. UBA5149]
MYALRKNKLTPKLFLWSVLLVLMAGFAGALQAQTPPASAATATPATAAPTPTLLAFDIEIQAPPVIQAYLQRHIELQRYRELGDLDASELARLLTAAERNVQDLLGTLGYFSPAIQLAAHDTPQNPKAARRVVITVQPGEPVKISDVTIEFTGPISQNDATQDQRTAIRATWALRQGMTFTQADWDGAKTQALRLLIGQRYPTGQILSSRADIDPDTKTARLSVTLDSGPAYRLGLMQISGTQRYDTQLVTRLARLPPGTDYSQNQMLEAQQRLSDSGFFDAVFVSLDTSGDPMAAPVLVQLREAKLQKIVLGVGASTDGGARLSMEHLHNKVPGIGWRAASKLSLDRATRSLGTELTAPPDDTGWRWVTSVLFQNQVAGSAEVNSQRYRAGRTQIGERIDRNYYLQYDRAKVSGAGVPATADALSANYAWTQRNFDLLPFPTSGYGLGAELGGGVTLGSSKEPYLRAQVRWLALWPLAGEQAGMRASMRSGRLATRAEGGMVLARTGADLPSTQLFLTGGDTSVRGYAYRSIGSELANGEIAAGRYLAVGSVEWQRPIVINDKLTDWESAVFLDAGAVADKPSALRAQVGVGAGVRWKSPVGPLQIDLAYGVATQRVRLHLSVGFTF